MAISRIHPNPSVFGRSAFASMDDKIQTTVRFPRPFFNAFKHALADAGESMNPLILRLVADWMDELKRFAHEPTSEFFKLLAPYFAYIPIAAAVKEVRGRVIFANPEFLALVGGRKVVGALPIDYWNDMEDAKQIMAQDRVVRERKMPLLCAERIQVQGAVRQRLTIRFPIFDRAHDQVEMTGVLGFDLNQIEETSRGLMHGAGSYARFDSENSPSAPDFDVPDSLLASFVENVPAIICIKNVDSTLLGVNAEYTNITGRRQQEVIGKRPTENWASDLGRLIEDHDREVRENGKPVISRESIPTRLRGMQERLNIRFPIFDAADQSEPVYIGTIGFDHTLITRGIELLRAEPAPTFHMYVFLPSDTPESLTALRMGSI